MGIEIETSAIKTDSWDGKFTILKGGIPFWELKGDTTDVSLSGTPHADHNKNVECSTLGGLGYGEINEAAAGMQRVLHAIYERSRAAPSPFTEDAFKALLPDGYDCGLVAFAKSPPPPELSYAAKGPGAEDRTIRPQITFQLPLKDMVYPFERLYMLGHEDIKNFLDDLGMSPVSEGPPSAVAVSSATGGEETEGKHDEGAASAAVDPTGVDFSTLDPEAASHLLVLRDMYRRKALVNTKKGNEIRDYFKTAINPDFSTIPEGDGKGLILLFLYYWYQLFNKKAPMAGEPGLKTYLGVMSRVPLSQLYDKLKSDQKVIFSGFVERHLAFAASSQLRPYKDYKRNLVRTGISVQAWYLSITGEGPRQPVPFKEGSVRQVDLLSPPPNLPQHYSMGLLDIDCNAKGLALVEARGYGKLQYGGSQITIDNIIGFVNHESRLFFGSE
ncbi:MAG: hypothetical protein K2Q34_03050 [Alphaproteobacteria bacterium]|nr:hypothetical protein [Alphaproteobacteria bacterium]